jgi:hypothetical protein
MLVVMDDALVESVLELHLGGRSVREIATEVGVPRSTVHRIIVAAAEDAGDDAEWEPPPVDDEADARYLWRLIDECFPAGRGGPMVKESRLYKLLFNVDMDRLAALGRVW